MEDDKYNLDSLRHDINEIDSELMVLLSRRRRVSNLVAESKIRSKKPVRDTEREEKLLAKLVNYGSSLGLDANYVTQIFNVIIADSVLNQQVMLQRRYNSESNEPVTRIAFLGDTGSYSYLAMTKYFSRRTGEKIELGCTSFHEIFNQVETGHADFGVLPIENTSSGSINEVYDLLQHTSLSIVGELTYPIVHCLIGLEHIQSKDIKTIYSHIQPYTQCSEYVKKLGEIPVEFCSSTTEAIQRVKELNDPGFVAIGSKEGGLANGLQVIDENLANQQENHSRFIIVSRKPVDVAPQIPAKVTLIMSTEQKAGALVDALLVLKKYKIMMTKLESRPIMGTPWEEMFYIDVISNTADDNFAAALKELEPLTRSTKVLGCYPSDDVKPVELS